MIFEYDFAFYLVLGIVGFTVGLIRSRKVFFKRNKNWPVIVILPPFPCHYAIIFRKLLCPGQVSPRTGSRTIVAGLISPPLVPFAGELVIDRGNSTTNHRV